MVERLKCDVRALVGPWSHEWPDQATPGPQIGYLQVCLPHWVDPVFSPPESEKVVVVCSCRTTYRRSGSDRFAIVS